MKKRGQIPPSKRMEAEDLMTTNKQGQSVIWSKQGSEKHLLLRHPNFVAKSLDASFEPQPLACEASALTTELTARNHIYFTPKNQLCKHRPHDHLNFLPERAYIPAPEPDGPCPQYRNVPGETKPQLQPAEDQLLSDNVCIARRHRVGRIPYHR